MYISCPSSLPQPTQSVEVSRIPVFVSEIGEILQVLRQQLTFNEVYSSCFPNGGIWKGEKEDKGKGGEKGGRVVVEVEAESPLVIYVCLMSEKIAGLSLSVSIWFALGGRMEVRIRGGDGPGEGALPLGVGRVEEILNDTKSVPILVHNLLNAATPREKIK